MKPLWSAVSRNVCFKLLPEVKGRDNMPLQLHSSNQCIHVAVKMYVIYIFTSFNGGFSETRKDVKIRTGKSDEENLLDTWDQRDSRKVSTGMCRNYSMQP